MEIEKPCILADRRVEGGTKHKERLSRLKERHSINGRMESRICQTLMQTKRDRGQARGTLEAAINQVRLMV